MTENDLTILFSGFGSIISTSVQIDKLTGRPKGFAFVSFDNPKSAADAIKATDGMVIGPKRLTVRLKKDGATGATGGGGFAPY